MALYVKTQGEYKAITPKYKIGSEYTEFKKLYVKVNGTYQLIYSEGTHINDTVFIASEAVKMTPQNMTGPTITAETPIRVRMVWLSGTESLEVVHTYPPIPGVPNVPFVGSGSGIYSFRIEPHPSHVPETRIVHIEHLKGTTTKSGTVHVYRIGKAYGQPTFIRFNDVLFKQGCKLPPSPTGVNYIVGQAKIVRFEHCPDFFTACTNLSRTFTGVQDIVIDQPFNVSNVTNFTYFLHQSRGTVDFTGWIWPSMANYNAFAYQFIGTLYGLHNLNVENLQWSNLDSFLANAQLTPKLDLRQWCVPNIINPPSSFGAHPTGYQYPQSQSIATMPQWGMCGNRSTSYDYNHFTPSRSYNVKSTGDGRYVSYMLSNATVTLNVPMATLATIKRLSGRVGYSNENSDGNMYFAGARFTLTVTYSSGRTFSTGYYSPGGNTSYLKMAVGSSENGVDYGAHNMTSHSSVFDASPKDGEVITGVTVTHTCTSHDPQYSFTFQAGLVELIAIYPA